MVKVDFVSNPKGLKKIELFFQATEDCKNLRYEGLIIVDPKYIKIFQSCCIEDKILTERN